MKEISRTAWNYTFQLTDRHLFRGKMIPLRYKYYELGAAAFEKLQKISVQNVDERDAQGARGRLDLYALLRDNYVTDQVLHSFWDELYIVPDWMVW